MASVTTEANGSLIAHVASPFLRHPAEQQPSAHPPSFRRSLERLERINMNDLEPIRTASERKQSNRLSREILGVDDPILSAPDNAKSADDEDSRRNNDDGDAGSVIGAASVASTVPDRYGFMGGNQYTQEHK